MSNLTHEESGITRRFLSVYDTLKAQKKIRFKKDFCQAIDMPLEYMSHFEKGTRPVPSQYLDKLIDAFGVAKDWLLYNRGGMFNGTEQTGGFNNVQTAKAHNIQGSHISAGDSSLLEENKRLREEVEKWRSKYIELLEKQVGG
jgi:hypothetical protein